LQKQNTTTRLARKIQNFSAGEQGKAIAKIIDAILQGMETKGIGEIFKTNIYIAKGHV